MAKILLIGHEGFLGRGLHEYFGRHHEVIGCDVKEDLFSLDAAMLAREGIEMLVNLAVIGDRQSKTFKMDTASDHVNVQGARHLASILKGSDITWIQMSTREVLGPVYTKDDVVETEAGYRPKFFVHEDYPYVPLNFYAKTKIMAEFISETHPYSNVIRLTTCYTDYDHPGGSYVTALSRTVTQGKPVTLTQGGLQFRDPLHSDDLGRLIELLHERRVFGERFHAGGGEDNLISLLEFVRRLDPAVKVEYAAGGDYGMAFDVSKAFRLAGWKPQVRFRDKIPVFVENVRRGRLKP